MNIYEKLSNIQQELKAPKNQYNGFGGYKYRSCEDILEAIKPLLKKNKCNLRISDELEYIGNRYYIKATVFLKDLESDEYIFNTAYAREEETKKGMDGSQITGASSSYARKYALNGLFLIDDVKDSDSTNTGNFDENKISTDEMVEFNNLIIAYDKDLEEVFKYFKIKDAREMTQTQFEEFKKICKKGEK